MARSGPGVSLKLTLVLAIVLLQGIATALVLASTYVSSERVLLNHGRVLMEEAATSAIDHAREFLLPAEEAAALSKRLTQGAIINGGNSVLLERFLFEQLRLKQQFSGLYYGRANGEFVFVRRAGEGEIAEFQTKIISMTEGNRRVDLIWRDEDFREIERGIDPDDLFDPRERPWFGLAAESRDTVWTEPYVFFTSQEPGVTVASPVYRHNGDMAGVVGVDIEFGEISTFLAGLQIGQSGQAVIFNDRAEIMAHPRGMTILPGETAGSLRFAKIEEIGDPRLAAAVAALPRDPTGVINTEHSFSRTEVEGVPYLNMFRSMSEGRWPWVVGIQVPEQDFIGALQSNRADNIILAITISAVSALIGLLIARSIIRPIKRLEAQSIRVGTGDFPSPDPIRTGYLELRSAGDAFARMALWLGQFRERSEAFAAQQIATSTELSERVDERTKELTEANTRLEREVRERRAVETVLEQEVELHRSTAEALRAARDRANAASRAKTRFLSNVSHEVRTPLNAILGFTALIRHDKATDPKVQDYASQITEAGKQLLALVDQILDLASIEAGRTPLRFTDAEIAPLIAGCLEQIRPLAEQAGLQVREDTEGLEGVRARVDALRFKQVMMNLASNAIKYNRPGGCVCFRGRRYGRTIRIEVEDSGIGIDPARSSEVFEHFNRLGAETSQVKGTGIGLSLSRDLVKHMKGRIGFESTPGEGSVFWVELSVSEPEDAIAEADGTTAPL